jgi:hypothetical protein
MQKRRIGHCVGTPAYGDVLWTTTLACEFRRTWTG